MTQLKHRIAIGKVVNGEWKFDHYATAKGEMIFLKPKADGRGVYEFFHRSHDEIYNIPLEEIIFHSNWEECFRWKDVSDTHRIEWGMETSDKYGNPLDIYNGDIFVDWNTGKDECSSDPVAFELFIHYDFLCADQFPMVEILGNVNENPELLEVGK